MFVLVNSIWQRPLGITRAEMTGDVTRSVGERVLTQFILPFELLAVLMLASLLGAIYFARPGD
jgi:NADH:ubiquinone oxidoreductase subunit 6 (subunit J)